MSSSGTSGTFALLSPVNDRGVWSPHDIEKNQLLSESTGTRYGVEASSTNSSVSNFHNRPRITNYIKDNACGICCFTILCAGNLALLVFLVGGIVWVLHATGDIK